MGRKRGYARGDIREINVERVRALLEGKRLFSAAKATRIGRRQLRRLQRGELPRTQFRTVRTLAKWLGVEARGLLVTANTETAPPGEFVAHVRARHLAADCWRALGRSMELTERAQDFGYLQLEAVLAAVLSADTWLDALYAAGTPIYELDS